MAPPEAPLPENEGGLVIKEQLFNASLMYNTHPQDVTYPLLKLNGKAITKATGYEQACFLDTCKKPFEKLRTYNTMLLPILCYFEICDWDGTHGPDPELHGLILKPLVEK